MVLGHSWGNMGCAGCASCAGCAGCVGCVGCAGCVDDRGSRPSEPREARRAKAEALMIMYFHLVSCLGYMLLCMFVLKSFSRCSRPRARFVELIRCSRPWAYFVELIRRFPFSAAQVSSPWRPYGATVWQDSYCNLGKHYRYKAIRSQPLLPTL